MPILQFPIFLLGLTVVIGSLLSAVCMFIVPRSHEDQLTRAAFVGE